MAAISWPAQLTGLRFGWRERFEANRINTQTDSGPGKARKRYTSAPRMFSVSYLMTESEVGVFDTFYHVTTQSGTLRFDYAHPRTGAVYECRFDGDPPEPVETAEGLYQGSFRIKTLGAPI